jgi:hypothetical protein
MIYQAAPYSCRHSAVDPKLGEALPSRPALVYCGQSTTTKEAIICARSVQDYPVIFFILIAHVKTLEMSAISLPRASERPLSGEILITGFVDTHLCIVTSPYLRYSSVLDYLEERLVFSTVSLAQVCIG